MTTSFDRRSFLKAGAAFAGSTLFGGVPFRAFADAAALAPADHCFVFAYFSGGWDILLSLDPRDPARFTAERIAETRIFPAYSLLSGDSSYPLSVVKPPGSNIDFGPAMGRMVNHFDVMAVVRGINMNTVAHEVGYRYFITGKEPIGSAARGSSTATEIVGQMAPRVPVPSIAYNVETYNDRYPGHANALRVSSSNDLLLTLSPSPTALDSEVERQLVDLQGRPVTCEAQLYDSRSLVSQYRAARGQMQTVLGARLDRRFIFDDRAGDTPQELQRKAAIRATYGIGGGRGNSAGERAALVATALKEGISQCVSINLTGGLDTHFGSQLTQANNQRSGWNALADLVTDLKQSVHPASGKPFIEHTTILVFSEFSRTPLLNNANGRDHHLTNAAMLLGKGIQHNRVYGRSGDVGLSAAVVDLRTGQPDVTGGQAIHPEHVIATVLKTANLDYSITRVEPLPALLT